jgi:hypothetical protein
MRLNLDKESVEVNLNLPATTFVLENTDRLKEVNLDEPGRRVGSARTP